MAATDPLARLISDLVAIDSVNPTLVPGAAGESAITSFVADHLRTSGLEVEVWDAAPGRPDVLAVLPGRRRAPGLLLCGHTDTVGVSGMTIPPFEGRIDGDRVYGRGSIDMKAGVAAVLDCARTLCRGRRLDGDLVVALVADEEDRSRGTESLIERLGSRGLRPVAGIIPEPTDLVLVHAHKGFVWGRVETRGRAAHGSDHERGVDAISLMARVVDRLSALDRDVLPGRTHPLLGRSSLHCSLISGGSELSTYPGRCTLEIERRLLPGETGETLRREVEAILSELRLSPDFDATLELLFERAPYELAAGAPIVRTLDDAAIEVLGSAPRHEGLSGWTDAQLLAAAGVPTVLYGPGAAPEPGEGGIELAHSAEEYASVASTRTCAQVLIAAAARVCGR